MYFSSIYSLLVAFFFNISGESQEIHDAELSARVLRLINITDSGLHTQVKSFPPIFLFLWRQNDKCIKLVFGMISALVAK